MDATGNFKVPVQLTIPVPATINPEYMLVIHFSNNGEAPEEIIPRIKEVEGKKVGVIAVKHFSDFTITQKSGTPVPTPSPTPTPTPENNYFWG